MNQHRDTAASLLGHNDMLQYLAAGENVTVGRAKYNLLESMVRPVGAPPRAVAAAPATKAK